MRRVICMGSQIHIYRGWQIRLPELSAPPLVIVVDSRIHQRRAICNTGSGECDANRPSLAVKLHLKCETPADNRS
jgi:hypothetical protein